MKEDFLGGEGRISIERRLAHLEGTVNSQSEAYATLMDHHELRMTEKIEALDEKLDRVIDRMERPVNWPAWLGAGATFLGALGLILHMAYIKPLEVRIDRLEEKYKLVNKKEDDQ